jgi:predicted acetylornithine/succinylornithine family transaminase
MDHLMNTYARLPVAFSHGEGAWLWDQEGRRYLDAVAGIAVCNLGHAHPAVARALSEQAGRLVHTSNLYRVGLQECLAERLVALAGMDRAFFCNSGAEANEAAIKLARKWALQNLTDKQRTIITAEKSFHGRTLTTITATGQEKYQKSFVPLPAGFRYVEFGNIEALEGAVDDTVCAIMLEPIQGEGGINVPDERYLAGVRRLCDERGLLLIFDEVQTGIGRTGEWFCYEHFGIEPDIMTLAKSLGGGFPIGACVAKGRVATTFEPGDHASTFGGNHLACAAALETLNIIDDEDLVANAAEMGGLLIERFSALADEMDAIDHIRGRGLLLGLQLAAPVARDLASECFERGLVLNAIGTDVLRLAPPLIIDEAQCERAVDTIAEVLQALA